MQSRAILWIWPTGSAFSHCNAGLGCAAETRPNRQGMAHREVSNLLGAGGANGLSVARLSKRTVDALSPGPRPYIVFDEDLTGFGLRIMPSGTKTWIVEYRPGAGGRKVYTRRMKIDLASRVTAEQARAQAREVLARVRLGEDPAGKRTTSREIPTLATFAEQFVEEYAIAPNIKQTTSRLYRGNLRKLVVPTLGSLKLDAITGADVARLHRKLGKATPTAANNMLVTLSSLYRYAGEIGLVARGFNPIKNAVTRHKTEKKERFLTLEEMKRLADTLRSVEQKGLDWRLTPGLDPSRAKHRAKAEAQKIEVSPFVLAAIRLLLFTGCRLGEIMNLRWSEVDFERGVLNLADSKTGKKSVILNGSAIAILSELPRVGAYVISGQDPNAPRVSITRQWYRIRELAGLDGSDGKPAFRLHHFRHSFASIGVGGGMGLPIVGKLLGTRKLRPRVGTRIWMQTRCVARPMR
jgi:integrase